MFIKKLVIFLTLSFILFLTALSFAQESEFQDNEVRPFPWESYTDYEYFEEASHFWNLKYRPGKGCIGVNAFELQSFMTNSNFLEKFDSDGEPVYKMQDAEIFDYWSGVYFGGVVHKYFFFKIEGDLAKRAEIRYDLDSEGNHLHATHLKYNWDMTYMAEMRVGIPLNKDFTLVSVASFRVYQAKFEGYETWSEDEFGNLNEEISLDIVSEIFIFRTQIQLFFEVFEYEKTTSLNVFGGFGYHSYQIQESKLEPKYKVQYSPDHRRDADIILGVIYIYNNDFMLELRIIPAGLFTASIQISYLT